MLIEYAPTSDQCRWTEYLESGQPKLPARTGSLDDFFASRRESHALDAVLVLNTPDISLRTLSFEQAERKHILKTASFELEESLVTDLESLHFAYAQPESNTVNIAILARKTLEDIKARFDEHEIELSAIHPLAQVLNGNAENWAASVGQGHLTVQLGEDKHFVSDFDQARLAWNVASRENEALPKTISLYQDSVEEGEAVQLTLPAGLSGLLQLEQKPWFVQQNWNDFSQRAINLLQGDFSPSIAWQKIWDFWKLPIIGFAIAVGFFTLVAMLENQSLKSENTALRQQMLQVYKGAYPNSNTTDPAAAMRQKLAELQPSGNGSSRFMDMFYSSASALAKVSGVNVLNVNFDARNSELRMDLIAKQFQDIEKIRSALAAANIDAELLSTSSVDGGERARMKLREQAQEANNG